MKRKQKDFLPIRPLIREVMKGLESQTSERIKEIERAWRALVGDDLARLTRVCGVSRRTVAIEAAGSAVLAEIEQFYREMFLRRLKEKGIEDVDRITFRLADG